MLLCHLLSSHLSLGPQNRAQDCTHRAATPFEIAVAKIKLALGRDHHDTSCHSTASAHAHSQQRCASHPRTGRRPRPHEARPERTAHLKPAGTEMPPSPSPSQGPRSPRSSSKSKLLFAILFSFKKKKKKLKEGSSEVGRGK